MTPIFLHFGILHILFNMLWLRDLGSAVEFRRRSLRFVLIVLSIGLYFFWFRHLSTEVKIDEVIQ